MILHEAKERVSTREAVPGVLQISQCRHFISSSVPFSASRKDLRCLCGTLFSVERQCFECLEPGLWVWMDWVISDKELML